MAKSKSQKKQSKQQKQQGGEGAADHALKVYGGVNEQHAVSDVDNTIVMKGAAPSGQMPAPGAPAMNGGKGIMDLFGLGAQAAEKKEEMVNGQGAMVNGQGAMVNGQGAMVNEQGPMANGQGATVGGKQSKQQLQKTIMKQLKQLKQQGGRLGFSDYASAPQPISEGIEQTTTGASGSPDIQIVPPLQVGGGEQPKTIDLMKGIMKAGDKLSKQQLQSLNQQLDKLQKQQQQGGVGLNEIVVPLVLLYASQKYSQGKTVKKGGVGLNEVVVPLVLLYSSQKYAQGKTTKKNVKHMSKPMRRSLSVTK